MRLLSHMTSPVRPAARCGLERCPGALRRAFAVDDWTAIKIVEAMLIKSRASLQLARPLLLSFVGQATVLRHTNSIWWAEPLLAKGRWKYFANRGGNFALGSPPSPPDACPPCRFSACTGGTAIAPVAAMPIQCEESAMHS